MRYELRNPEGLTLLSSDETASCPPEAVVRSMGANVEALVRSGEMELYADDVRVLL